MTIKTGFGHLPATSLNNGIYANENGVSLLPSPLDKDLEKVSPSYFCQSREGEYKLLTSVSS